MALIKVPENNLITFHFHLFIFHISSLTYDRVERFLFYEISSHIQYIYLKNEFSCDLRVFGAIGRNRSCFEFERALEFVLITV